MAGAQIDTPLHVSTSTIYIGPAGRVVVKACTQKYLHPLLQATKDSTNFNL